MNDTTALPPPPHDETPTTSRRLNPVPLLYLAGFAVLAAAIIWLWKNPPLEATPRVDPAEVAALKETVQTLQQQAQALQQQTQALQQQNQDVQQQVHSVQDELQSTNQKVAALEQRPVPQATDLKPLEDRVAALEQRPPVNLEPLEQRIAAVEKRPQVPPDVATRVDLAALATRLDAQAAREDQLATRQQGLETTLGNRLDQADSKLGALDHAVAGVPGLEGKVQATDKRVDVVEKQAGQVTALADKAGRIGRLQAAQTALETGQPLGEIPDAPPALARFARTGPPTEAALRLSFPAAARAAEEASRPPTEGRPFLDRVWSRAQDLVTIREGDKVIVGDPASGIIARARRSLMAGDLPGAVAALDALSGPAAQAMAEWKAQAQELLDARAALASLAARA